MNAKPQPRYGWPSRQDYLADAADYVIPISKQFVDQWNGQWIGPVRFRLESVPGTNLVNMVVQNV